MTDELAGKVAIVTGGASGLGGGIVERFAAEGAKVVIADVDGERGAALAAETRRRCRVFVAADVGRRRPGRRTRVDARSSASAACT